MPATCATRHSQVHLDTPDAKLIHLQRTVHPVSSLAALARRCPTRRRNAADVEHNDDDDDHHPDGDARGRAASRLVHVLRVPKAGSTSFFEMLMPCLKSRAASTRTGSASSPAPAWRVQTWPSHEVLPTDSCDQLSVAILRDPCDRLVSMYRHFEILWGLKLHSHWVRNAPDADAFVAQLRAHWSDVLGNGALPITPHFNGSTWARPPIPKSFWTSARKHDAVLMPQKFWVGNYTRVLCLNRFDEDLAAFFGELGCTPPSKPRYSNHEVDANSTKYTLTSTGCAAARELFHEDAELWDAHCAARRAGTTAVPLVRHPTVPFARGVPSRAAAPLAKARSEQATAHAASSPAVAVQ